MKKVLFVIVALFSTLFLLESVSAKIVQTNIVEAVEEEINYFGNKDNFEDEQSFNNYQSYVNLMKNADLSNYKESDDKVNIYIFRGKSCWHCLDEISWLSSKVAEYGKYINIRTYEVWNNKDNSKLMNTVAKKLGETASGVPYTIIGKQTYSGFSEETGNQMLSQVQTLFNSSDRYDIKNDINLEDGTLINSDDNKKSSSAVTIILIAIVVIAGGVLVYYVSKSK